MSDQAVNSWWFEFFNTGITMICLEESFCQSINMLAILQTASN